MFKALKAEFFPGLEVSDEGGYWEPGDLKELARRTGVPAVGHQDVGEGLEKFGLSSEAAGDPEIITARIARVAQMVQNVLKRPSEHPPVHWDDESFALEGVGPLTPEEEARWDASFKENRRRQERIQRAMEKHLAQGESIREAHDNSMREETALGLPEDDIEEDEDGRGWRDSLPDMDAEGGADNDEDEDWSTEENGDSDPFDFTRPDRHPLLQRSSDLLMRLHELFHSAASIVASAP